MSYVKNAALHNAAFYTFSMPTVLKAHFEGDSIRLDEPFDLPQGASVLVTVLSPLEQEREEWTQAALHSLARAYGDDEPEYTREDLI